MFFSIFFSYFFIKLPPALSLLLPFLLEAFYLFSSVCRWDPGGHQDQWLQSKVKRQCVVFDLLCRDASASFFCSCSLILFFGSHFALLVNDCSSQRETENERAWESPSQAARNDHHHQEEEEQQQLLSNTTVATITTNNPLFQQSPTRLLRNIASEVNFSLCLPSSPLSLSFPLQMLSFFSTIAASHIANLMRESKRESLNYLLPFTLSFLMCEWIHAANVSVQIWRN